MDELWHAIILDTQLYADLQDALCLALHHGPSGAHERYSKQLRLATMKALYRVFFSATPLVIGSARSSRLQSVNQRQNAGVLINIVVATHWGPRLTMAIDSVARVEDLKQRIHNLEGIEPDQQRIIFAGRQLEDGRTLD